MFEMFFSNKESTNQGTHEQDAYSCSHIDNNDEPRLVVSYKTTKLEFPRFLRGDLKKWFGRVD